MNDEALVKEIAGMVIERIKNRPRKLLALFSGAMLGFEDALESLSALPPNYACDALLTPNAAKILDKAKIQAALRPSSLAIADEGSPLSALKGGYDGIIAAALTTRATAHVAALMADAPFTTIIQDAIMRGTPVIAAINGSCPACWAERGYTQPAPLAEAMSANLEKLRGYGVRLCLAKNLGRAVEKRFSFTQGAARAGGFTHAGRVVGAGDVNALPNGATLNVPKGATVTALAREAAFAKGVTIVIGG